ncbi:MAG: hypothetical protein LBI56_04420 [Puniceicoccales bacterium]|jgi:hypothetical protein|nr:hypothetical protein [Puniceicoccales bacterium]
MKISVGEIILARGDVADEHPYDFKLSNIRQIQIAMAMRAGAVRGFDRGNLQTTVEFKVSRRHESVGEAQTFVLQHAASLNGVASTLAIVEEPSGNVYLLNDIVIGEVQSGSEGVVSVHFYKIIGGLFTKN